MKSRLGRAPSRMGAVTRHFGCAKGVCAVARGQCVTEFDYRAAVERWPGTPITLRQGARVIEDSRRLRLAWSDKGREGGGR
jgi:hypothetical protein